MDQQTARQVIQVRQPIQITAVQLILAAVRLKGTYTVKAGESVWSVANKNGITMDQLIEWNNIKKQLHLSRTAIDR